MASNDRKDFLDMSLDEINQMYKKKKYGRAPYDSKKRNRYQTPYSNNGLKSRIGFKNGSSNKSTVPSEEKKVLYTLKLTTGVSLTEAELKELFSESTGIQMNDVENGTSAEINFSTKEDALEAQAEYKDKVIDDQELHIEYIEPNEPVRPTKEIYRPPKKPYSSSKGSQPSGRFGGGSRRGRGGGGRRPGKNIDPRDIKISVRLK